MMAEFCCGDKSNWFRALTRCLDVVVRSIETHLLQRAGIRRASRARTGVVTHIQRHGSAANLNVHLHMLVLDGVVEPIGERVRFRTVAAPGEAQLQRLLTRLIARIVRRLTKDGWLSQDTEPPSLDLEPRDVVDELAAASIRYRIADGPGAGQRTLTLRSPSLARPSTPKPLAGGLTADLQGFSLNAAVACSAVQRNKLERLARYVARPAIALERLAVDTAGRVVLELTHPFRDGTTHMVFSPEDWMARLAALVPRPRAHLTRYPFFDLGSLRAQLSTAGTDRPITPWRCHAQAPAGQGVRSVAVTDPACTERRRHAPRAHDLGRTV